MCINRVPLPVDDRYNRNGNQPLYVHKIYSYQQAAGWEKSFMNRNEASQCIYQKKKKYKEQKNWNSQLHSC